MSFNTGRAVKATVEILRRDAAKLLPLAALLIGLPNAATTYLFEKFTRSDDNFANPITWIVVAATFLVAILSTASLQALVARGVKKDAHHPTDRNGLSAIGQAFAVLTLGLITGLGTMIGFVLLIIPGIILTLAWFVTVPAMVTERLGVMDAIRRSNRLTGNARGSIFGLVVAISLAGLLFGWLVQLAASAANNAVVSAIAGPAEQSLTGLINAALAVAVYNELRRSQEGTAEESLEAVFA
jgi:hypothetical protein